LCRALISTLDSGQEENWPQNLADLTDRDKDETFLPTRLLPDRVPELDQGLIGRIEPDKAGARALRIKNDIQRRRYDRGIEM
jgi:hypothetical protein